MTDATARLASELAGEYLHHYARGRTTFAVDALPDVATAALTDALQAEFTARGVATQRVAVPDANAADAFRTLVLPLFRSDAELPADAVLLVEGTGLHAPGLAEVWNSSLWLSAEQEPNPSDPQQRAYLRESDPPRRADVIIDVRDPAHPERRFSDWCVLPKFPRS